MINENKKIEKSIQEGLVKPGFDLSVDYAEIALDEFLDNDVVRNIPIVKSIVGVVRGGMAVRELFLAKKILTFLKVFHTGKLDKQKKKQFLNKFNSDNRYKESVIEQVTILNDRFISVKKSEVLSNLLLAHINGKFDWEAFCQLGECLDDLHTRAFEVLANSASSAEPFYFRTHEIEKDGAGVLFSAGLCVIHGNHYSVNAYGQYLCYYGILGDIDFTFPSHKKDDEN